MTKMIRYFSLFLYFLSQSIPSAQAGQSMHITTGFTASVSSYYQKIFDEINRRYPNYHFIFEELSTVGYLSGLKSIHDTGSYNVVYVSKPPAVSPCLIVNKKHKAHVKELTKIIEGFDMDGTLDRLYQQTIDMYKSPH